MDRNSIEIRIRKLEEELSKLKKEFEEKNGSSERTTRSKEGAPSST